MKLLILASTYPRWVNDHEPGFIHELAKRMTSRFEVTVLCPHAPGARPLDLMDGVSVVRFRYAPERWETLVNDGGIVNNLIKRPWLWFIVPFFFLAMAISLIRLNRQWKPDVIHAHWIIPQGLVVALLKALRIKLPPVLLTSHGGDLFAMDGPFFRRLKRRIVAYADGFSVVSSAMREFAESLGIPKDKILVRSMGVDLAERFKPGNSAASEHAPTILFVGRLVEKKGADVLLESLPWVLAEFPGVTASFVGFGPEESRLKAKALESGLNQSVCFVGAQDQGSVARYYRESSVLAAPFVRAKSGDADGLGLVVAEALASGCPVVTSDLPATNDITSGMQGVINVSAGSPRDLARALLEVLRNQDQWHRRASEDRPLLVERLDWSAVAGDYERYLASLAGVEV